MLFKRRHLDGIAAGTVTVAFRRWDRVQVRAGGRLRTAIGVVAIDEVAAVSVAEMTDRDAEAAGFGSRDELISELSQHGTGTIYRISLRLAGPDPRILLRSKADLTDDELSALLRRLARLDAASRHGAWTAATLRTISEHPGVRAADLAAQLGRDRLPFKVDVRKLKELGLTESLEIGYRLSPRGHALLAKMIEL